MIDVGTDKKAGTFYDDVADYEVSPLSIPVLEAKRAEHLGGAFFRRIAHEYAIYTDGRIAFLIRGADTDLMSKKTGKRPNPGAYEDCVSTLFDFFEPQTESVIAVKVIGAGQFFDRSDVPLCLYMVASEDNAFSSVVQARYWATIVTRFPRAVTFRSIWPANDPGDRDTRPLQFIEDGIVVAVLMPWRSSQSACDVVSAIKRRVKSVKKRRGAKKEG